MEKYDLCLSKENGFSSTYVLWEAFKTELGGLLFSACQVMSQCMCSVSVTFAWGGEICE